MDFLTVQKLILINLEPIITYVQDANTTHLSQTSFEYLTSDYAKLVYMMLSIVSTYGALARIMRARNQINTPYLVLMTFFLYTLVQSTRSALFGNPWKLLQSDQLLTVFLAILFHHFLFYPFKFFNRMFEKLKIFHNCNLFLSSYEAALLLKFPPFNSAVLTIFSFTLSPLFLKLEQAIWNGVGPVISASIGQGMVLYLLRISLDQFLPHICESERYGIVQAFIFFSWLLFSPGFWDNLIGSIFSRVSPAWENEFYEQQNLLREQYYQNLKTQKKILETQKKKKNE
jgi:hypothetical protein